MALRDYLVSRARCISRAAKSKKSAELFQKSAELLVERRRAAIDRHVSPLPGQAEYLDLIRAVLDLEPDSPAEQLKLLETWRPLRCGSTKRFDHEECLARPGRPGASTAIPAVRSFRRPWPISWV